MGDVRRRLSRWCSLPLLLLLAIPAGRAIAAETVEGLDLYLLMGQSNMAGRGQVDAESAVTHPRVQMLDKALQWVPAVDPVHFDKPAAGVGPGLAFAKRMAEARPAARIGLIPCAVGGTSIKVWVPGALDQATQTHPYDDMLVRARSALGHGVLRGVLWHQGEADRARPATYAEDLTALVERVRQDLGAPRVPFIAGELATFKPGQAAMNTAFNGVLHGLEARIPAFTVISAAGTTDRGDHLHFDAASARTMGLRYAEALLGLAAPGP